MSGERRMFRYEVPVDDEAHSFRLTGSPVAVDVKMTDVVPLTFVVEFWAESNDLSVRINRAFRVFGTGQQLPDGARWVGTCPRSGGFVWHLYELKP